MPNSTAVHSATAVLDAVVPWESEAWPIIEHEPERIPDIPPDFDWPEVARAQS